jgi:glycosyltransferase involved in cell wall biosynthesis
MAFISVIIPTFNRSGVVVRAINSVLDQNNKNFELIVVDDGSTDETELLLSPLNDSGQLKYFKIKNLGVSSARNFGVSQAIGDWLCFLDSDDEWLPNKLQDQLEFVQKNSSYQIVYSEEIWIRNGVRVNPRAIHQKHSGWVFDKCVQQCFIAPSSVMLRKSLFHEMGGFDPTFTVCEDYDLWLKISSLYEVGLITIPCIIKHGGSPDQLSTMYVAMDLWRLRALCRIIKIRNLSDEHKDFVHKIIAQKGEILKKGFLKYGNHSAILEVESLLQINENE